MTKCDDVHIRIAVDVRNVEFGENISARKYEKQIISVVFYEKFFETQE